MYHPERERFLLSYIPFTRHSIEELTEDFPDKFINQDTTLEKKQGIEDYYRVSNPKEYRHEALRKTIYRR